MSYLLFHYTHLAIVSMYVYGRIFIVGRVLSIIEVCGGGSGCLLPTARLSPHNLRSEYYHLWARISIFTTEYWNYGLQFVPFDFNIHNELTPLPHFHNWIFNHHPLVKILIFIIEYFSWPGIILRIYNWAFYQFTINMLANLRFQMEWSFISFYPRYQSQNLNLLIVFITF